MQKIEHRKIVFGKVESGVTRNIWKRLLIQTLLEARRRVRIEMKRMYPRFITFIKYGYSFCC